jgi:hypothetical protein
MSGSKFVVTRSKSHFLDSFGRWGHILFLFNNLLFCPLGNTVNFRGGWGEVRGKLR